MCNGIPFTVEKISVSSFCRESNPGQLNHQAYREKKRQSDSQPARRTDNQRERERERDIEGEMKTVLLHCSNFTAKLFKSAISFLN